MPVTHTRPASRRRPRPLAVVGTIHRKSVEFGPEVCTAFADTSYFESLRLEPYYLYAADRVPAASGFLELSEESQEPQT